MFRSDKRERVMTTISTLIAAGTKIQGDVGFEGGLHLEGRIEGTVTAQTPGAVLTQSEKGSVKGRVRVFNAVINGSIEGDLHVSERLELGATARIVGNVYYKVLEMAAGAQINGAMIHDAESPRQLTGPAETDAGDETLAASARASA